MSTSTNLHDAIIGNVQARYVTKAKQFFTHAIKDSVHPNNVMAVHSGAFTSANAMQHMEAILSACLLPSRTTESKALKEVTHNEEDIIRGQNTSRPFTDRDTDTKVTYMEDGQIHAACFEMSDFVFFTLRTSPEPFEFGWSKQLKCLLECGQQVLHMSTGIDSSAYFPLEIQRFETYVFEHSREISYHIRSARSLARTPTDHVQTYDWDDIAPIDFGHNPWPSHGIQEDAAYLLAGCLHQILKHRTEYIKSDFTGSKVISLYYFDTTTDFKTLLFYFIKAILGTITHTTQQNPTLFNFEVTIKTIQYRFIATIDTFSKQIAINRSTG